MVDKEVWKTVIGYEGNYEVSNLGNVRSLPRDHTVHLTRSLGSTKQRKESREESWRYKGKLLKPIQFKSSDSPVVHLYDSNGKRRDISIKKLVAIAFLGAPVTITSRNVRTLDGDPSNCRVDNLQVVLPKQE